MEKIDANELTNYISNRKCESRANSYSALLKRERLSKDLTLEEVASGICSVSYLSKVENNQIDAKEDYIRFLFDRLSIDYDHAKDNDYAKLLSDVVECYYYNDNDKICKINKKIDYSLFDCDASLISIFYNLVNVNYSDALKALEEVDSVKSCLSEYAFLVYVFLLGEYSIKNYEYYDGYKYLKTLDDYNIKDPILKNLIYADKIICCFHCKKFFELINTYRRFQLDLEITIPLERRNQLDLMYKIILGLDDSSTKSELLSFAMKNIESNALENTYLALLGLIKFGYYNDVIDIIESSGIFLRCDIFALYGCAIVKAGLKSKYLGFLQLSTKIEVDNTDNQHYKFIEFLKMIMEKNDKITMYEYIRYKALSYSKMYPHILYDDVIGKEYVDLLISFSKYKDSTNFLKERFD